MNKAHRAIVAACAAIGTLVFASAALATYAPKLVVSGAGGQARIGVLVASADDPTAKVTMYVPNGYAVASAAPGSKLGDFPAPAAAPDLGGAVLPLTGELDAIPPTATTNAQAQQCGVTPTQTWDLH